MKLLNILLEDTRIETIAQKLVSAYNTYNGSNSVSIYPNSITDSRFEISSDGGKSGMGDSYFMVNLLGDVYLSDGVSSQFWFNEKDSDKKIQSRVNKILNKSASQVRTSDEPEEDAEEISELNAKQLFTAAGIGLATLGAPNMGKAQQKEPTPISQTTQQKDTTITGFGLGKSSQHHIAKQMARMKATADLMQKMKVQTLKGNIEIKSEKTFQTSNGGYEVEMTVAVSQ